MAEPHLVHLLGYSLLNLPTLSLMQLSVMNIEAPIDTGRFVGWFFFSMYAHNKFYCSMSNISGSLKYFSVSIFITITKSVH